MEQRLIDANALVTDISFFDGDKYHYGYSKGMIESSPTVDAVPVVRCGECYYKEEKRIMDEDALWCRKHHMYVTDDWFCADGERRSDGEQ